MKADMFEELKAYLITGSIIFYEKRRICSIQRLETITHEDSAQSLTMT